VGTTVHEYVQAIDVHPDHIFDLVLVDGRARTECIRHAIPKIKPGAYLMLDNSNNAAVSQIVRKLQSYPHIVFRGIAPGWPPTRSLGLDLRVRAQMPRQPSNHYQNKADR
jgi:hypothetical protein